MGRARFVVEVDKKRDRTTKTEGARRKTGAQPTCRALYCGRLPSRPLASVRWAGEVGDDGLAGNAGKGISGLAFKHSSTRRVRGRMRERSFARRRSDSLQRARRTNWQFLCVSDVLPELGV